MYNALPTQIKQVADKAFALWSLDTTHQSLFFKPIPGHPGQWSARITLDYRAVCIKVEDGWLWYGTGDHSYFDKL